MAKKNLVIDNPDLMSAWDWEKNNAEQIYPENYASGSRQKAWWICKKGHSYQSRIAHKKEGHMCPYCSGRLAIPGETDLATLYPSIASEWDYKKNFPTTPNIVKPMCNDAAWWVCDKGHSYSSVIANRVSEGSGCPYCSNKKVLAGLVLSVVVVPGQYQLIAKGQDLAPAGFQILRAGTVKAIQSSIAAMCMTEGSSCISPGQSSSSFDDTIHCFLIGSSGSSGSIRERK